MGVKIPSAIVIPDSKSKLLYGFDPVVITMDDVNDIYVWWKLAVDHSPYLEQYDFKNYNTYIKYFMITLGLMEYSLAIVSGDEGSGKSLGIARLTYEMVRQFGKRATLDWTPPNPALFGKFHSMYDEDFTDRVQNDLNRLARLEKQLNGQAVPMEELAKCIVYNAVLGLDECDSYAEKSLRTNLTRLIGRLVRRRRHYYLNILMAFVDADDADKRMIFNRRTHEITCYKDAFPIAYPGYCSYLIKDVRRGGAGTGIQKWLHLNPEDNTPLWRSHNMVSVSHDTYVNLSGKKPEKEKK